MVRIVEIEGDIARIVEREIVATTTLDLLAPHMEVRAATITPTLPLGTRIAAFDPEAGRGAVIIEAAPARTNLNVHFDVGMRGDTPPDDYARGGRPHRATFNIQLPFFHFVYGFTLKTTDNGAGMAAGEFTIDRSYLYMSPAQILTPQDKIWHATMMNVEGARICWGYGDYDNTSLNERLQHMVNEFPNNVFNNHYGMPRPIDYDSYTAWEAASENPFIFRNWKHWNDTPPAGTVAEIIKTHLAKEYERNGHNYQELPLPDDMTTVIIPEPPAQFTQARMREWARTALGDNDTRARVVLEVLRQEIERRNA